MGVSLPYTMIYRNYKEVDGVRLPFEVTEINEMTGESTTTYDSVGTLVKALVHNSVSYHASSFHLGVLLNRLPRGPFISVY